MDTNKIVPIFKKIKWSIVLQAHNDLSIFTQCMQRLVKSVDVKRCEVILLKDDENELFLNVFKDFCEAANLKYTYGDDVGNACNMAMGEYIAFLSDHTIVSANFLVRLTYCAENFDQQEHKTAIVSPISNEMFPDLALTPMNLDEVQSALSKQPKTNQPWEYTLKLFPFCLLVKKEAALTCLVRSGDKINAKDTVLATNYSGYLTVVNKDTLVYHYPELEVAKDIPLTLVCDKLAVLYKVKVDDDYMRDTFVKSLEKSLSISDNIYVLDNNSKLNLSIYLKEKHADIWSKITKYERYSRTFDERRDINELLSWAEANGDHWALVLEGDEIVEDKVDRDVMLRLMNPVNPEVMTYKVNHYYFWGENWRLDAPWGKMCDIRLTRLVNGRRITRPGLVAGQCGYTPDFPLECMRETSIRIKNYGYVTPAYRQRNRELFEKLNFNSDPRVSKDFNYITNVNGMHSYPFLEHNTVSFYTPTKIGGEALAKWLDSIVYFADEVVVGNDADGLSQDDLAYLSLFPNVKVVPSNMDSDYGEGRNQIIKNCTSKWILQLDIDERVTDLSPILRMVDVPIHDAWMFDIDNLQADGGSILTQTMRLFRNKDSVAYWGRLHETIDNHVAKFGWKISKAPTKIVHYGYILQKPDEAYKKMQRYLEINLQQMKETPDHGMSYYSVALHFIEDGLLDDAIKLLEICAFLLPNFPLAGMELGKIYIQKAHGWIGRSIMGFKEDHPVAAGFRNIQQALDKILPKNYTVAKGHCLGYFGTHKAQADWLREHLDKMARVIEKRKLEIMEKRAAAQ